MLEVVALNKKIAIVPLMLSSQDPGGLKILLVRKVRRAFSDDD